jgi:hypothetical protein
MVKLFPEHLSRISGRFELPRTALKKIHICQVANWFFGSNKSSFL